MNPRTSKRRDRGLALLAGCLMGLASLLPPLAAQSAPGALPDAATLAKYDRNNNGVLDPEEQAARRADQARTAGAGATTTSPANRDDIVELTPFQVSADADRGYYAANTLSGTRINSKLEDLGASISVVTKQQMQDFALLDINDVFLYEANTEGIGNYTDFVVDRNGNVIDNVASNPTGANRVRGIGSANTARGNFQTSGRVPLDPINTDAVEISRGPNSNIFGLGSGSGTVNVLPTTANLTRDTTSLELRVDSYGSTRESLDISRPLIKGKLAVRGSAVHQEDEFIRKPSFSRTNRYNGYVQYKPFRNTSIRGWYERYENYARRPNFVLPRDAISNWRESGSPTWDPTTSTVTRNGVRTVVPYDSNQGRETTALGPGLESGGTGLYARPSFFVDRGVVDLWMINRLSGLPAPSTANPNPVPTPNFQTSNVRLVQSSPGPRVGPLAPTVTSITDKSVYDWSDVNIAAANWTESKVDTFSLELDQFFFNTPRHVLAAQAGWFQEDSQRYSRSSIGTGGESPMIVYVDVNEKLLDGRPNPYFLRPYINGLEPTANRQPLERDIYRGQIAYKLNLSPDKGWWRWLGDHAFSGYYEYKDTVVANYRFRDVILSDHAWLPPGGNRAAGSAAARSNYRYYLGDNQGQNIEYGSPAWRSLSGTHDLTWFDGNRWVREPATLGEAYYNAANPQRTGNRIKTRGIVTQNHFLDGRIVTTFGLRKDDSMDRRAASTLLNPDGITADFGSDDAWPDNWFLRSGETKTKGAVLKPLRGWGFMERRVEQGSGIARFAAEALRSLSVHYNQADSFIPASIAQNLNTELLPNPTSEGEDYGVSFNLFDKFVIRLNKYETLQLNSRTGDAGIIATRTGRLDFAYAGNNDAFNLQRQATSWVSTANPNWTQQQIADEVARTMGFPLDQLERMNANPVAETSDVVSKGKEIEISFNPSGYWTSRVTVAEQKVVEANVTPAIQRYIDARMPVWTQVIDLGSGQPWFTTRYGSNSPQSFLESAVLGPYKLLRANEGKSRPQIRQWRVNAFSTLKLAALSENKWLKRMSVSGAVRWEDKASIGYYTYADDDTAYDPNRRIYDDARFYVDAGVNYTTRIYREKVGLRLQLNVRNVFENGRLQAVGALPNGVPYNYRIVDPRLFILTAAFSL